MADKVDSPKPKNESERSEVVDGAEMLNAMSSGWNDAMGISWVRATRDEVVATLEVGHQHRQPYGIVHGGVYCGFIEAVASTGAAMDTMQRGQSPVGLENHTSFISATRKGKLTATGKPITRGRRTQVWEVTVVNEEGRVAATGRVRLFCLDEQAPLAGEPIEVQSKS